MGRILSLDDIFDMIAAPWQEWSIDADEYWTVINFCQGLIVLACKEQASKAHRAYSGRIKTTLRLMHYLEPEQALGSEFHLDSIELDAFSEWEKHGHTLGRVLESIREEPESSCVRWTFEEILAAFGREARLRNAMDVMEEWTSRLESGFIR